MPSYGSEYGLAQKQQAIAIVDEMVERGVSGGSGGTGTVGDATAAKQDAQTALLTTISNKPAGDATAAKQDAQTALLTTISNKPAGDATAAKQDAQTALLTTISNKPAGDATAAKQDAQTALLSSIDLKNPTLVSGRVPVDGSAVTQPVSLSLDVSVSSGSSIAALNLDLLSGGSSAWYDARAFHSCSIQVIGGAGITAGQVTFEQTNDIVAASVGNIWVVEEETLATGVPVVAAIAIAANTTRIFRGAVTAAYVRVRVSTAFAGGTVQAIAVFSQQPFVRIWNTVTQGTAANLNVTLGGAGTSSTNLGKARGAIMGATDTSVATLVVRRDGGATAPESTADGRYLTPTAHKLGAIYVAPIDMVLNMKIITLSATGTSQTVLLQGNATKKIRVHRVHTYAIAASAATAQDTLEIYRGTGVGTITNNSSGGIYSFDSADPATVFVAGSNLYFCSLAPSAIGSGVLLFRSAIVMAIASAGTATQPYISVANPPAIDFGAKGLCLSSATDFMSIGLTGANNAAKAISVVISEEI